MSIAPRRLSASGLASLAACALIAMANHAALPDATDLHVSPRMYVGGCAQYNSSSSTFSTHVRWRWEYTLSSERSVVYTDDQSTHPVNRRQSFDLLNRAGVVTVNRLYRY